MRAISRINVICDQLNSIWKKVPDWRFMQMMVNFIAYMRTDCFYMEDEEFIKRLTDFVNQTVIE